MRYTIRKSDIPVLEFSADSGAETNLRILWVADDPSLLPLDLAETTDAGVEPFSEYYAWTIAEMLVTHKDSPSVLHPSDPCSWLAVPALDRF